MIFGDHYAYGIDEETIWEYDDIKIDNNPMDIHNVPMIIHAENLLENTTIANYMSTIDVMPTIANLFGLAIDDTEYSKLFGNDVLASCDNIVRFADMSYVSKYYSYDSLSEDYTFEYEDPALEFLKTEEQKKAILVGIYNDIFEEYKYNLLVLQYDYFKEYEDIAEDDN
jgi:phosphoglycerol transferase MdoB-like AlkP superfamily enzyme